MRQAELTLKARYVFPVDTSPIESGCVRIDAQRITYVGQADRQADIDLGNAAIVPGFVNAHTHLELSGLRARDFGTLDFASWLRHVIEARRGQTRVQLAHAVSRGIDASLAAGTTLIGDISTGGRSWQELLRSPLRAVVFCEMLGLKSDRAAETAQAARQFLEWVGWSKDTVARDADPASIPRAVFPNGTAIEPLPYTASSQHSRRLTPSLSPHAPYSTHALLYELAAHWSRRAGVPVCTHLAESKDELRLLQHRDGPLREFLASVGAWDDEWTPAGGEPVHYLEGTGARDADWVIAHGNYLTDDEISRLAQHRRSDASRRAIVYCPRTHSYFGHSRHPYSRMLAAGLTVCLGTDSLASTATLSVLDEMRFLHRRDEGISCSTLLHMATLAGAWALRCETVCGSLTPGKFADLAVIRLPDREADDPHQLVLQADHPVVRTMLGGRFLYQMNR